MFGTMYDLHEIPQCHITGLAPVEKTCLDQHFCFSDWFVLDYPV